MRSVILLVVVLASSLSLALAPPASACGPYGLLPQSLELDVAMAQGKLLADKKQTTYLKVGLKGFRLPSQTKRAQVNVALVLDKSGSMSGDKLRRAKQGAIDTIRRMSEDDIISVVAYDSTVKVIVPATKLTDREQVIARIQEIEANGSTALFAGVSKGAKEVRKFFEKNRVNRVVLLSDGLANVGPRSPSELGNLGASLMEEGIAVSTLGLGLDYNEDLMSQLARRSGGNHVFVENSTDLVAVFKQEFDDVLSVVAQEVAIKIDVDKAIRPVRVLNMDAEINGQEVIAKMNQLYSDQERFVLLEVEVPPSKANTARKVAAVHVSYANMATQQTDELTGTANVSFSEAVAETEKSFNTKVMEVCVLVIANERNKQATTLRDQGQVEEARKLLLFNADYLGKNAKLLNSIICETRGLGNTAQANNLDDANYSRTRKGMRELQNLDDTSIKK